MADIFKTLKLYQSSMLKVWLLKSVVAAKKAGASPIDMYLLQFDDHGNFMISISQYSSR